MANKVRVRFAPSPTGGLHLGGVRTVLFNYLFAKKHQGDFIVRVEDTDQTRWVDGAEKYIFDCLDWCGLVPDESVIHGGPYTPYRQSERKPIYRQYAEQLIQQGNAYYAFDTSAELEAMREKLKAAGSNSLQYDHHIRMSMNNSLRLLPEETKALIDAGTPYVIRIKVNSNELIPFSDMIRGEMEFDTNTVDDKVLLKADGMPTYHLAVVIDDYLMKISHAFRGEEWLPSAPVHILLWKYLFGLDQMPHWAHLPLILKPVYAMDWIDPTSKEVTKGFKELGFLPEAFINLLAVLGWNDGTEQEVFSLEELIEKFSIEKVHKGGAKFDFEKAKWFNQEWIKKLPIENYKERVKEIFLSKGVSNIDDNYLGEVMNLIKERCIVLPDFYTQGLYFFDSPSSYDEASVKPKWDEAKKEYFNSLIDQLNQLESWDAISIETIFKQIATEKNSKVGELQMMLRVFLVGSKMGPGLFIIAETIGKINTLQRIENALKVFGA
jgi:glutamyl-tRNA synthetase